MRQRYVWLIIVQSLVMKTPLTKNSLGVLAVNKTCKHKCYLSVNNRLQWLQKHICGLGEHIYEYLFVISGWIDTES